ncbi:hypothetical protein Lalb_Chr01g0021511 [Lupinus albus]|uniref:Uncharacterized protein n=1 Tax=Lupinus albus TaxID=3870 RepID=A0A6A4R595_LUPAL|nr:hypothetical protein Lalb_Chr01g0021511 [Lupinus albus]
MRRLVNERLLPFPTIFKPNLAFNFSTLLHIFHLSQQLQGDASIIQIIHIK